MEVLIAHGASASDEDAVSTKEQDVLNSRYDVDDLFRLDRRAYRRAS